MRQDEPIWITGAAGMVGAALTRYLRSGGYTNLLTPTRSELDLCSADAVQDYVEEFRPKYAFLLAAKVGGIVANMNDPVGFLDENLRLVVNQLGACSKSGVKKILLLGSTCIYPRECAQPMIEDSLLTGPLEPTNEGYALAKIAGLRLAQSYQKCLAISMAPATTLICPGVTSLALWSNGSATRSIRMLNRSRFGEPDRPNVSSFMSMTLFGACCICSMRTPKAKSSI